MSLSETNPQSYIVVDLGGTSVRAAHYTAELEQLARAEQPTNARNRSANAILQTILETISHVMPSNRQRVVAIGIGAPGPINPYTGTVIHASNIPSWRDYPLVDLLSQELGLPVYLGNDANLAALAEWKFGAARGHQDVLYLTVSTGIGGGVISQGRMLLGAGGLGAELGHLKVVPDGPVCGCGQRGHLEALASGPSLATATRIRLQAGAESVLHELVSDLNLLTPKHIGIAARQGDVFARQQLQEVAGYIGQAIASYLHIFNPSIVVLGGGVMNLADELLPTIRETVHRSALSSSYWKHCDIVTAQLEGDVGLLGALALALEPGT
jgi:glucokinase